ncbi:AraC family transcriptional regulator [Chitinophaga sp. 212800010-3]|uniref:helix-turn-helix transcriptional regulator n=1 Tax=unclassified Chitinophaga TaxID=2619133 RepID=UPI002DEDC01E|nr:hypothetical protein [Chitinophaga sp. 212800010-3]
MNWVFTNNVGEVIYTEKENPDMAGAVGTELTDISGTVSNPVWQVSSRQLQLPGIQIGDYQINVREDVNIHTYGLTPRPGLFFLQQGTITSKLHEQESTCHFSGGQHAILYNPFAAERSLLKQQQHLHVFVVTFDPEYFLRLAEDSGPVMYQMAAGISGQRATHLHRYGLAITPRMNEIIADIKSCPYRDGLRKLFIQAKITELLTLQCAQIGADERTAVSKFRLSAGDLSRIYMARDIIVEDIQHPPSLTTLTRMSGLNEFKLKAGFKSVFSTTVFGYLNDHRLLLAKKWIARGDKALSEIAYDCGYSSLAHFSNAFKKKFGASPIKFRG